MPDFGTLEFILPYGTGQTIEQDYVNYLDSGVYENLNSGTTPNSPYVYTGNTSTYDGNITGITYFNTIGKSKLSEYEKYGGGGYTIPFTLNGNVTGYTIDNITYEDQPEGYSILTYNNQIFKVELMDIPFYVLSRNEHFLGFVDEPKIYSDIYVERGKQGVMEMNLRLGEIDNMGELSVYGNGYFKVKKQ